jgi:hypothetical protein
MICGDFSISGCCTHLYYIKVNGKTMLYIVFKCKPWTKVIKLNTDICNQNIFFIQLYSSSSILNRYQYGVVGLVSVKYSCFSREPVRYFLIMNEWSDVNVFKSNTTSSAVQRSKGPRTGKYALLYQEQKRGLIKLDSDSSFYHMSSWQWLLMLEFCNVLIKNIIWQNSVWHNIISLIYWQLISTPF